MSGTAAAPDDLARTIGLHHTLPTAIADLVDNSIDAGARHVLVRFVQRADVLVGLRIIDDGRGMDADAIDAAMAYGRGRDYGATELGHFGVGLKAASLSQASTLTVYSHTAGGDAVGRRITAADPRAVVTMDGARSEIGAARPRFPFTSGTVVEWGEVRTVLRSAVPEENVAWLDHTITDVRNHLGIVFHRWIERGLAITVDTFDVAGFGAGAPSSVPAIDPFGYPRSAHDDYPRTLELSLTGDTGPARRAVVTAHLWPARLAVPNFRLYGAPGRDRQGLYVYRADRLLQVGGWLGLVHPRPELAPARVSIDLDETLARHITINPEKSGVTLDATIATALREAVDATGVVSAASDTVRAARARRPRPITVTEPATGLPEDVLDTFADAFTFGDGEPVSIGWRALDRGSFFEVDLSGRRLWINSRFRTELVGHRSFDPTDEPVLKTLLYLLVQDLFDAQRHSARQIERMRAWQDALVAAVTARRDRHALSERPSPERASSDRTAPVSPEGRP